MLIFACKRGYIIPTALEVPGDTIDNNCNGQVDELNVKVHVTKESSPEVILAYGVMITPAIIIDEINVHSGSIPKREAIKAWLKE